MKLNDALSEMLGGVKPPTQMATYQDLNYMKKYWGGNRDEYKPKKTYVTAPKGKKKKKKPEEEPEEVKNSATVESYGLQKTRDVPRNYLNRALTPFFQGDKDGEEYEPKKTHLNKPPKKKKKAKKDEA